MFTGYLIDKVLYELLFMILCHISQFYVRIIEYKMYELCISRNNWLINYIYWIIDDSSPIFSFKCDDFIELFAVSASLWDAIEVSRPISINLLMRNDPYATWNTFIYSLNNVSSVSYFFFVSIIWWTSNCLRSIWYRNISFYWISS